MERQPNTEYILALSYGKDSLACLEAIKRLGYPLDRIVHAEVWATDTISADLPPMVSFKEHADKIIKERYGYTVEHVCAMRGGVSSITTPSSTSKENRGNISGVSMDSRSPMELGATTASKSMSLSSPRERERS